MTSYLTFTLADFFDQLASSEPVPGGGSASALAGATGVSLLLMVAGMSKTKTGAPEETADLAESASRLRPLRDHLMKLVDSDSDAYQSVMAAFRLPRNTDEEKATRKIAIQASTRQATLVPLETMQATRDALQQAAIVAANGNKNAASDVGTAIELLLAGLRGASMNVEINLAGLTDQSFVQVVKIRRSEIENTAMRATEEARRLLAA
jgi:glutamate formiminotransferase/formiminotetrahydrofolate cyclodeaminase